MFDEGLAADMLGQKMDIEKLTNADAEVVKVKEMALTQCYKAFHNTSNHHRN